MQQKDDVWETNPSLWEKSEVTNPGIDTNKLVEELRQEAAKRFEQLHPEYLTCAHCIVLPLFDGGFQAGCTIGDKSGIIVVGKNKIDALSQLIDILNQELKKLII